MPKHLALILTFCFLIHTTIFSFANSEAKLLKQHLDNHGPILAEDNMLTVIYEGEASNVVLCCSINEPLRRLDNSNIWVFRKTIPNLSELIMGYTFIIDGGFPQGEPTMWRGPKAPKAPKERESPFIRRMLHTLDSEILGESREVFTYLPPNHESLKWGFDLPVIYLADGEATGAYGDFIEALILQGKLPAMLLIGIESGPCDFQGCGYIPDENDDRFELHERFIIEEVLPWAETKFGASTSAEDRAIYGHLDGGVFAALMGLRNPDVFGYSMPFSLGLNPTWQDPTLLEGDDINTKFYFVAGELEENSYQATRSLSQELAEEGIDNEFHPRVAGHDYLLWSEAFPDAVLWAFGIKE